MVGMRGVVCPCMTSWQLAPPACVSEHGGKGEKGLTWSNLCAHGLLVPSDIPIVATQVSHRPQDVKHKTPPEHGALSQGSNRKQVVIAQHPLETHILGLYYAGVQPGRARNLL